MMHNLDLVEDPNTWPPMWILHSTASVDVLATTRPSPVILLVCTTGRSRIPRGCG